MSNGTALPPEASTNAFLRYFLPLMTAINTPLSLTNFFVFLNTGFLYSPSVMIYFNLVIVDLLTSAAGIMNSVNLWKRNGTDHQSMVHWGDKDQKLASYIYIFTFEANVWLVFGLCLIRVLWTEISALHVLGRLRIVSGAAVVLANVLGMASCLYTYFSKTLEKPGLLFPAPEVEAKNVMDCLVIFAIFNMSIYTQVRVCQRKSQINYATFVSASKASLIITLNVIISYSYYIVMVATRIYYEKSWDNKFTCPKDGNEEDKNRGDKVQDFFYFLLCDELYLSITFMSFQCTVNSGILLFQQQTRSFLRTRARMCLMDVRSACLGCCGNDSDYEYL